MSSLTISRIETDLMRSAPIGPARELNRIFGAPGLRSVRNAQASSASAASSRAS